MEKIKQWIVSHKVWSIVIASVLVVAIALSISLPLALRDRTVYTVSDDVFANALDFKDADGNLYTNWQAECVNKENETIKRVKLTENGYYAYIKGQTPIEMVMTNSEDDGSVKYTKANADAEWEKTILGGSFGNTYLSDAAKAKLSISNLKDLTFTYNAEDKMYHATQEVTTTSTFNISSEYTLKFVNGKLVGITQKGIRTTIETGERTVTGVSTWTISYGNATIEIPTVATAE